jgi:hypothetical protein
MYPFHLLLKDLKPLENLTLLFTTVIKLLLEKIMTDIISICRNTKKDVLLPAEDIICD